MTSEAAADRVATFGLRGHVDVGFAIGDIYSATHQQVFNATAPGAMIAANKRVYRATTDVPLRAVLELGDAICGWRRP